MLGIYTFLVNQSWRIRLMRKSWLLCVLMGTLSWGQAVPGAPPSQPAQAPAAPADTSASVPDSAVVLTVNGVCPAAPKAPAAAKGDHFPVWILDNDSSISLPNLGKPIIVSGKFRRISPSRRFGLNHVCYELSLPCGEIFPPGI